MKENYFKFADSFFHFTSKLIIIIPLIVIITSFFLRFNQRKELNFRKVFPTLTIIPTKTTSSFNFNLNGPLICKTQKKDSSISAYIKDKKIFAVQQGDNEVDYFLLRDDCFYWWKKGVYSGEMICGVGSYFDQLLQLALVQINNLNLYSLSDSCRKEEIKDDKIFEIPSEILFKNTKLNF